MRRAALSLLLALALAACVTINVYFPEAAAEKAADRIIQDVWGKEEARKQEGDEQTSVVAPERGMLVAALTGVLDFVVPAAQAQELGPRGGERRSQLEARVRQQFARVVKERLDLTDEQLRKLGQTTQRYEERRRLLLQQERDARMGLRQELMAGDDKADQERVARLLDQLVAVQRQRLQIFEEEQRELATFLTPVQRAKFAALQEALRKRVEQARQNRTDRRDRRPPRPN